MTMTPQAPGQADQEERELAAALAACQEQTESIGGIKLEGHPTPLFNGVYVHVREWKGWPVFENGAKVSRDFVMSLSMSMLMLTCRCRC